MSRLILIFGLFLMNFNLNYVKVESIEYLQEDSLIKEVKFSFESDSLNFHDILVNIKLYNQAKELLNEYQSSLKIIGRCEKTANIKFEYEEDFYAIIEVKYQDKIIVDGAKIEFYHQEDCLITDQDNYCNAIYKSEYRLGQSKDLRMEFNINKELFNVFLATNKLDVTNYRFYSNYDLDHKNAYLVIENSVNEYDLLYYKGYLPYCPG